jgi:hypothetical protein
MGAHRRQLGLSNLLAQPGVGLFVTGAITAGEGGQKLVDGHSVRSGVGVSPWPIPDDRD